MSFLVSDFCIQAAFRFLLGTSTEQTNGVYGMRYGSFSHNYRPDKLRELIKEGKTAKEIMKELSISRWSLKEQLLMLQHRDKTYYEIPGLHDESRDPHPSYTREGIIFSPKMLDKTGFKPGDRFEMTVEKDKIILTKIT